MKPDESTELPSPRSWLLAAVTIIVVTPAGDHVAPTLVSVSR